MGIGALLFVLRLRGEAFLSWREEGRRGAYGGDPFSVLSRDQGERLFFFSFADDGDLLAKKSARPRGCGFLSHAPLGYPLSSYETHDLVIIHAGKSSLSCNPPPGFREHTT
jgi:hypothetical protein